MDAAPELGSQIKFENGVLTIDKDTLEDIYTQKLET